MSNDQTPTPPPVAPLAAQVLALSAGFAGAWFQWEAAVVARRKGPGWDADPEAKSVSDLLYGGRTLRSIGSLGGPEATPPERPGAVELGFLVLALACAAGTLRQTFRLTDAQGNRSLRLVAILWGLAVSFLLGAAFLLLAASLYSGATYDLL